MLELEDRPDLAGGTDTPTDGILCVTQDEDEDPRFDDFREICAHTAFTIAETKFCHHTCGGHPICKPCFDLAKIKGWIR